MYTIQQETNTLSRRMIDPLFVRERQTFRYSHMTVRAMAAVTLFMSLVVVLAACAGPGGNDLRGTAWELASMSGSDPLPGTTITIEFSETEISGSAGCNHYGGSYQVSERSLTISDIFWTEMACLEPEGILEQESAYLATLGATDSYQLTGDQLEILDEGNGRRLAFIKPTSSSLSQAEDPPKQPDGGVTVATQNGTPTPDTEPTPTAEDVAVNPSPTAEPPPGYRIYEDATAGVSLFLPDSWVVTQVDPGRWAILQSYPEDKYVGGEGFQPGDTKCDLNIRPTGTYARDLIQQWKSNPDTTILSEEEIILDSGAMGTQLEVDNRGHSLSMFVDARERAVVLTCFGEFAPFDAIARSLRESEIVEGSASSMMDSPTVDKYEDLVSGVTVDMPRSWVVTGMVPGHRATLQSYPVGKYVGGEALQAGDTKCDLNIRPPGTTMAEFVEELKANSVVTILAESEVILESGLPGIQVEIENMGHSLMMITEITGQVVLLNCYGEYDPFNEIALSLRMAD